MVTSFWQWDKVQLFLPYLAEGAWLTLRLATASLLVGVGIGLALALAETAHSPWLRGGARAYVEFFRGTPLLVQIFLIAFVVPYALGYTPNPIAHGVAALGLNAGAYVSQVFRSSLAAVDPGQVEAARALGMTYAQALRYVVLPQAFRVALPPLTNEFVALLKDTSLLFALGIPELLTRARLLTSKYYRPAEPFLLAALIYLVMTLPLSQLARHLERRLARGERAA